MGGGLGVRAAGAMCVEEGRKRKVLVEGKLVRRECNRLRVTELPARVFGEVTM